MRKILSPAVLVLSLVLMPGLGCTPAHAAPGNIVSIWGSQQHTTAGNVTPTSSAGTLRLTKIRSGTYPVTISKIRPVTKNFGYLVSGNERGLCFFLRSGCPISGRTPAGIHPPTPAGRSP